MTANPLSTIPPIGPTTGMPAAASPGRFKPIDPLRLARAHMGLLILTTLIGLGLGYGAWYVLRQQAPQFKSEASLLVSGINAGDPFDPNLAGAPGGRNSDIGSYMANEKNYIESDEIVREAIGKPEVQNSDWFAKHNGDVRGASLEMQKEMLSANPVRGTTLINITMTCRYEKDTRDLLTAVVTTYLNRKRLAADLEGSAIRTAFISERERAADEMLRLKENLANFLRDNEIDAVEGQRSYTERDYATLSQQQIALGLQLDAATANYEALASAGDQMEMSDEEYAYLKQLPNIAQRESELLDLAERRRVLEAEGKQASHPMVKKLDRTVDATRLELQREMDKEMAQLRALKVQQASKGVEGVKAQLASLEPKMREASRKLQDLTSKLNEYRSKQTELVGAQEKFNRAEAALDDQRLLSIRPDSVRIRPQTSPTEAELAFPKMTTIIPGVTLLLLGLVAGLITVREMLDQRVKSPMDVKLMPDINLLGLIPHATEDPSRGATAAERAVETAPTGLLAESYRQVRTAVLAKMERRGYKTLVCVAAQPESGTSTVVQNLAASLAYNGRRVVIVDANFRRPAQHRFLDAPNDRGLVDVLNDRAKLDDVLLRHGGLDLAVVPTGQAGDSPPELLEGAAFRGLLGRLESDFDLILIDAPPALLTSDSQLLAKHVDAIAVIVQAGSDKRGMLMRMLNQLDGQRADVLGVILNGVKSSTGGYFRKSYEEFYRYGERPGRKAKAKATNAPSRRKGRGDQPEPEAVAVAAEPAAEPPRAARDSANGRGSAVNGSNGHSPADEHPGFVDASDSGPDLDNMFADFDDDEADDRDDDGPRLA